MSRTTTGTVDTAIESQPSFKMITKFDIYPTRVFFQALTRDNAVPNADAVGVDDNPMKQTIIYNATAGLVTFYCDGDLKYALDGDATPVTTTTASSKRPGAFGDKIFVIEGTDVKRYTVNWSTIAAKGAGPFSLDTTLTPTNTPLVVHAISETECIVICDNDGGFTISYFNATTEVVSSSRFMFPSIVDWDNSDRTMESMAQFSAGAKLGSTKIFIYMSDAATGIVNGMLYDTTLGVWSDIFVAMPTELEVSLCEFRVTNAFERNSKIYLVGQFIRTDVYETGKPYTLILSSENGNIFNIDRFTQVSDLGYRFFATVGTNGYLYLASSNRVCQAQSTWYFDGTTLGSSQKTSIDMDDTISISGKDASELTITMRAGNEVYIDHAHFVEDSRVELYIGYKTSVGNEYVLYGTYIVDATNTVFQDGVRSFILACKNLSQQALTNLSMPFYAELHGLSSLYDPMTEQSGKLYAATGGVRTFTYFYLDLWNHEGYSNSGAGITGQTCFSGGAVQTHVSTGSHKYGLMLKRELDTILNADTWPKITATTLTVKLYGWSKAGAAGQANDTVNLVMITCDEDGNDEQTHITTDSKHWKITYPYQATGTDPIVLTVSGMTVDRYIKKVGLVYEAANGTEFCPGRIEFTNNVEVPISIALSNTPWSREADGTFKVPSAGQPFIMFAQRPYNAFNFVLTALFENTVTGGITGYPVATGLIGLAEDASNYIIARYDKVSNTVQLVKVRNGVETQLTSAAPGWALGTLHGIEFKHQDGHFEVSMYREATSQYELVLSYDWADADGFMYTSSIVTKKTGIYGAIISPTAKILGYSGGAKDDVSSSDGMAIAPMEDITDFPSSGDLWINDNVYSYSGKITPPSYQPGPHQLRNVGKMPAPYGTGEAGVECLLFDWYGVSSVYKNKLIAIDNGSSYLSTGSWWRVFIKTSGQKIYLYNRSRHMTANDQLARAGVAGTMRVWPACGGFTGISLKTGSYKKHSYESYVMLNLDGEIKCYWFAGSGGQSQTTIRDLIDTTTQLCGASADFPGDHTQSSLVVNGETSLFQDSYSDGFDLEFELDAPESFVVRTNIKIKADNYEEKTTIENDTGLNVAIDNLGSGNFAVSLVSTPSDTTMYKFLYSSGTSAQKFRVLFAKNLFSLYQNNRWVWSMAFDELLYTQTNYTEVKLYTTSSVTFNNIAIRDLSDWREAVYIDLETDGFSALSSIIQERPVEIETTPEGKLRFYYERVRPEVVHDLPPHFHKWTNAMPTDGASDAIVYGANDVVTLQVANFARDLGFSTKLVRVPNLEAGAIEAGYRMMEKSYQNRKRHSLKIRPDVRLEVGDIGHFGYVASGTGRVEVFAVIIETLDISMSQSEGEVNATMTISGRQYDTA